MQKAWTLYKRLHYCPLSLQPQSHNTKDGSLLLAASDRRIGDLIQGKCEVNSTTLIVLYNYRATHSFISYDCANRLSLSITNLPYVLKVSTPTKKFVKTSQACLQCRFQIVYRTCFVDLKCLPLSDLDILLDMDCLSGNHIMLNYFDKTTMFPLLSFETVKPVSLYLSSLESGNGRSRSQGYILLMVSEVNHDKL